MKILFGTRRTNMKTTYRKYMNMNGYQLDNTKLYFILEYTDRCVGHTAWAAEGREGRSQAGPKGPKSAS